MHTATASHPAPETLLAFALGCLETEAASVIESHILTCPACSQQVEHATADDFVRLIRSSFGRAELNAAAETVSIAGTSSAFVCPHQPERNAQPPADGVPAELADHPRYRVLRRLGGGGMGDMDF